MLSNPGSPEISQEERNKLDRIIAGLYQFRDGGVRGRQRLIDQAGLSRILHDVNLDGEPNDIAWDINRRLRAYGTLPIDQGLHAFGALLRHVLSLDDLPQEEARFIAGTIVKYILIADNGYRHELCVRYNLPEEGQALALDTRLTVNQRRELHRALLSAFPPQQALADMLRRRLNEDLREIASTASSLNEFIVDVVNWAEENQLTEQLIEAARRENPSDPILKAFAEQMLPSTLTRRD